MNITFGFVVYAILFLLTVIASGVLAVILGYRMFVRGVMPEVATEAGPWNLAFLDTLARVRLTRGETLDALTHPRAAVERNPDAAALEHTLSLVLEASGDLSEAIAAMRQAVSRDESHKTELSRISAEASATSPR